MWFCTGPRRTRMRIECTHFYTQYELFKKFNKSLPVWLEYGPNLYQPVNNETELRFACQMVERDIDSFMSTEDRDEHRLMIADQAHTKEYENSIRPRGKRKNKDSYDTNRCVATNNTMMTGLLSLPPPGNTCL
jgi:hypothetical protein